LPRTKKGLKKRKKKVAEKKGVRFDFRIEREKRGQRKKGSGLIFELGNLRLHVGN
jgi:hypothetical protein